MDYRSSPCCHEKAQRRWLWYRDRLVLVILSILFLFFLGIFFTPLKLFSKIFSHYLRIMSLPVLAGLLMGGLVDYFVPKEYISKHLSGSGKRSILYSVGLGFLMSACSHGILALSVELYRKGASIASVMSFLLASPWANLPVTFLLVGLFGTTGILIIGSALWIAFVTGYAFQFLDKRGWIEVNPHTVTVSENFSVRQDLKNRWKARSWNRDSLKKDFFGVLHGIWELSEMVLGWILIGMVLASIVSAWVPDHFFHHYMNANGVGLFMTLAFATVLEICSEGTAPLAFEIFKHTGALGNCFVFLMAGVVTDYTEIGILWTNIGRKTVFWLLLLTIPQTLFLGWIYNVYF